jgi:hypothetical protein
VAGSTKPEYRNSKQRKLKKQSQFGERPNGRKYCERKGLRKYTVVWGVKKQSQFGHSAAEKPRAAKVIDKFGEKPLHFNNLNHGHPRSAE